MNDQIILYSTCPGCGAEEEIGRAINPEPEDLDQLNGGEPVVRLCQHCEKQASILAALNEVLNVFKKYGLKNDEAAHVAKAASELSWNVIPFDAGYSQDGQSGPKGSLSASALLKSSSSHEAPAFESGEPPSGAS